MDDLSLMEWFEATDMDAVRHPDTEFVRRVFTPGAFVGWTGTCYILRNNTGGRDEISPDFMVNFLTFLHEQEANSSDEVG